jgi:regulator-associated protein of mTOR
VFNKNFTQYIPLSIYDLQTWLGSPSIYVFDCSSAGVLINNQQNQDDHIIFAACAAGEFLPQNPDLPADMFTSCLTTPIKMALRWFCTRSSPLLQMDPDLVDKIPGRLNERKTVLGELNWIFTAITDTIAWNLLPPELFQRLFRQVSSLHLYAFLLQSSRNCIMWNLLSPMRSLPGTPLRPPPCPIFTALI